MARTRGQKPPQRYASMGAKWMAETRWKGTTAAERREMMSRAGKLGGRPPRTEEPAETEKARRCFCGERTMWSACQRNFDCCRSAGVMVLHVRKYERAE